MTGAIQDTPNQSGGKMANSGDMKAHEQTYSGVMNLLKWGSIATAAVAALVILIIAT